MNKIYLHILLLVSTIVVNAQENNFSKSIDIAMDVDNGWEIHNFDNGFLILSGSFCDDNTIPCAGLTKVDEFGNIEWKKVYRDNDLSTFQHISVKNDTFYLFARSNEHIAYATSLKVTSFDKHGDSIKIIHIQRDSFEYERAIVADHRGLLLASQQFDRYTTTGGFRIRRFDYDGNMIWEKEYDDPRLLNASTCKKIIPTKDGNYLLSRTDLPLRNVSSFNQAHHLTKINPQGEVIWEHIQDTVNTILNGGHDSSKGRVIETPDGGFVTFQNYDNRDADSLYLNAGPPILYKVDANGNEVWRKVFYGFSIYNILGLTVNEAGDIFGVGGNREVFFKITRGETRTDIRIEEIHDYGLAGWLFKLSSDGVLEWSKAFLDTKFVKKRGVGDFNDIRVTSDGDLMITGLIRDTRSGLPQVAQSNTWLVRVDSNGCFSSACRDLTFDMGEIVSTIQPAIQTIQLRPNPVVSDLIVDLDQSSITNKYSDWTIMNLQGQIVATGTTRSSDIQFSIDVSDLAHGTYFLQLFNKEGAVAAMGKFMKM